VVSASVIALTEGVLRTMFLTKLKLIALLVIFSGSAVLVSQATAQKPVSTTEISDNRTTPANDAATRDAETDLIMLERAWADAIPRRDVAIVNRILSEDFAGIDPIRNPYTKAAYLRDLENGVFTAELIELDEVKPRIFGETGVVTSRIKIKKGAISSPMTKVYVKQQGRWQCVASHGWWYTAPGHEPWWGFPTWRETGATSWNDDLLTAPKANGEELATKLGRTSARPVQPTRISPRFDCLVEKVYVKVGQTVKKGDPLADLFSTDLAAAKNDYQLKNVQWRHDRKLLQMRQKLAEANAISQQLLVDTQNAESRSLLEFQIARQKLRTLGLDDEAMGRVEKAEGEQTARLILRAPIDGTVTQVVPKPGVRYNTKARLMFIVLDSARPGF
jgi:ketosteroid isomerase-like protein